MKLGLPRALNFLLVALLCLFLGAAFQGLLEKRMALASPLKDILGLSLSLGMFLIAARGLRLFKTTSNPHEDGTRRWMAALVLYSILMKILYLDLPDLVPEEAYYWVYSQHAALAYLDHPPLVAWGILMGTTLFGHSEFGVRIFTLLCWFLTLAFLSGLSNNVYGPRTRLPVLLLGCFLPYTFLFGFFATPDAPLMASWAGVLYFLERALLGNRASAWWGIGVCAGFGMLSKYSLGLLGPSTLLILLLDKQNRHWLRRPGPYLAALLALLIFTPVLYWNQQHDWASFGFQSSRRYSERAEFKTPELLIFVVGLLTPLGIAAVLHMTRGWDDWTCRDETDPRLPVRRKILFLTATAIPLSVFLVFSATHLTKFSWTGPIWLALLPVIAAQWNRIPDEGLLGMGWLRPRLWLPLISFLAIMYSGSFRYMSVGLPLIPYPQKSVRPMAWEELGLRLDQLLDALQQKEGQEPMLIGLDRHFIASEASFYRADTEKALRTTRTEHVYGGNGTMYEYWFPDRPRRGSLMLLVGFHLDMMEDERIGRHFEQVGPVHEDQIYKRGKPAGRFFYRIGRRYLPDGSGGR